jgi:hypothetical protein
MPCSGLLSEDTRRQTVVYWIMYNGVNLLAAQAIRRSVGP